MQSQFLTSEAQPQGLLVIQGAPSEVVGAELTLMVLSAQLLGHSVSPAGGLEHQMTCLLHILYIVVPRHGHYGHSIQKRQMEGNQEPCMVHGDLRGLWVSV